MKLDMGQFQQHLQQPLQAIYLLCGDELLLREEARQQLREAAHQQGFVDRIVLHGDAHFKWNALDSELYNASIFQDKQYIELNWHKGSFPKDASALLKRYASHPSPNQIFALVCPKIEASVQRTKWFKEFSQAAGFLTLWPIPHAQLPRWIQQRMQAHGLNPTGQVTELLAENVEGNLLAAAQQIEKCVLLYRPTGLSNSDLTPISETQLLDMLHASAEYSIFDWVSYLLQGNIAKALLIYQELTQSGNEIILLLWAISKEIRLLLRLKSCRGDRQAMNQVFTENRVWKQRQGPLLQACKRLSGSKLSNSLQQCHQIDCAIKGLGQWPVDLLFQQLMLQFSIQTVPDKVMTLSSNPTL